ncbi:MAG: cob(I)yrinic acid a,c-diamide adenosyltransferase [Sulfolobaceae archaeon]|nr:cob(I)yrinic acid a,c-diamide adenosyltransferase [Sulfolobaceae archaeon]
MFTKKGDSGYTEGKNGEMVSKDSELVNFFGTIDEVNSFIGYALNKIQWDDIKKDLMKVQEDLFVIGEEITSKSPRRKIDMTNVKWLEERTVTYRKESGPIKLFVIPRGSEEATLLHIVRSISRRAERSLIRLSKEMEIDKTMIIYLNRLSSLLFAMAAVANKRKGIEESVYDIGKYF